MSISFLFPFTIFYLLIYSNIVDCILYFEFKSSFTLVVHANLYGTILLSDLIFDTLCLFGYKDNGISSRGIRGIVDLAKTYLVHDKEMESRCDTLLFYNLVKGIL